MIRSRLFWKIFISYSALILASVVFLSIPTFQILKKRTNERKLSTLTQQLEILAKLGPQLSLDSSKASQILKNFSGDKQTQFSLVNEFGTVVSDSRQSPTQPENLRNRPEIVQALSGLSPAIARVDPGTGDTIIYAAKAFIQGGSQWIVRGVATHAKDNDALFGFLASVAKVTFTLWLAGFFYSLYICRKISKPMKELLLFTKAFDEGDFGVRFRSFFGSEFQEVGNSLNRLVKNNAARFEELHREESQLRAILTNMSEGVIAVAADDTILFVNSVADAIFGNDRFICTGRKFWEVTALREVGELVSECLKNQSVLERELTLHINKVELILNFRVSPFQQDSRMGAVIVIQDNTNLRRLEKVRQDFVANVSHELKTPLTSIHGYVETLMGDLSAPDTTRSQWLGKIRNNVSQLTHLVQDLLHLGRIEAEASAPDQPSSATQWNNVVSEVLDNHRIQIAEKNIHVTSTDSDNDVINADLESLRQIADNLFSNAIRYSKPQGQLHISKYTENAMTILSVEDTGIGIPAADLDRIFERFYRVDKARSRTAGGTGLGLSIVKNLATRLGGHVEVSSEIGKGSIFKVFLPKR